MIEPSELLRAWAQPAVGAAAVVTWASAWLWIRAAPGLGLLDRPSAELHKRAARAVPLVGGLALVCGWTAAVAVRELTPGLAARLVLGAPAPGYGATWAAVAVALAVGIADDRRPFGVLGKLGVQSLAGLVLAAPWLVAGEVTLALAVVLGAVVAMNAANTFDNADGALLSTSSLTFALVLPAASASCAAALAHNFQRQPDGRTRMYLGDGGSHAIGMLACAYPPAWGLFALPLLDLARVALERARCGARPWAGDRRHLAHRLERAGLGRGAVALSLCAINAPAALLWAWAGSWTSPLAWTGVALTGALFAATSAGTRSWAEEPQPMPIGHESDRDLA